MDYGDVADVYDSYVVFDEDIPFFLEEARRADGPMLELTSGTGRVSLPLLRGGVDLTCVDASGEMLAILRRKLEEEGLSASVLRRDVRELDLPGRFALAIWPFHAIAELESAEDRGRALRSVHDALRPGGRFVCTLHNPPVRRGSLEPSFTEVGRFEHDGGELVLEARGRHDEETGVVEGLQRIRILDARGGLVEEREVPVHFVLLTPGEFRVEAAEAGFQILDLFGDYGRGDFDPEESPYMIWVLERPSGP